MSPVRIPIPAEIQRVLGQLRTRIRRYVLVEGLALVVVLLGTLFWGSFLVDWAWFQLSRLELPRWFRAGFLVSSLGLLAAAVISGILFRLFLSLRSRPLALVLERRFPTLDDRLVAAVEASEGTMGPQTDVGQAMLERAISDAASQVRDLDLNQVFNPRPLQRAVVIAGSLLVSILGLWVVDGSAMERWVNGYLGLRDGYWKRESELSLKVLVQPGDRVREFRQQNYRHPRGSDLVLLVEGAAGKKLPDRIRLDYRLANGRGTGRAFLTPVEGQPILHTLGGLLDTADIWLTGGDFTNAVPWHVEVVDPPAIDRLVAQCRYPDYTGLNDASAGRKPVAVDGRQTSLPLETDFILEATANKPLVNVRLEGDAGENRFELEFGVTGSTSTLSGPYAVGDRAAVLTLKSSDGLQQWRTGLPANAIPGLLDSSRKKFSVPFQLLHNAASKLPEAIKAGGDGTIPVPLPLPPDMLLRIYLEDADGIISSEPARLTINGIIDQPPVVEVEMKGISSSITRQARIPIAGTITDDYGLARARFEFLLDDGKDWQPRDFFKGPEGLPKEYTLARSTDDKFERFDVLSLDLNLKQKLILTVIAQDGNNIEQVGPNKSRSKRFVFTIVTNEELLSILYGQELNLRKRFERILVELKETQKDLVLQRGKFDEWKALRQKSTESPELLPLEQGFQATAERSLHAVRKNATETSAVEDSFRGIREELVNNAVDTPQMLDRMDRKIIGPLKSLNRGRFPDLDATLGLFRLAVEKRSDPTPPADEAITQLGEMIAEMEQILLEMRKLETFHEALELLKGIIDAQNEVKSKTQQKRKENAIKALE